MPHIFLAGPILSPEEGSGSVAKFVFPLSKGLKGQGEEWFWPRSQQGVSQVLAGVLSSIQSPWPAQRSMWMRQSLLGQTGAFSRQTHRKTTLGPAPRPGKSTLDLSLSLLHSDHQVLIEHV